MKLYKYTIGRRSIGDCEPVVINDAKDVANYLQEKVYNKNEMWREKCYAVFLDSQMRVLGHMHLGTGGTGNVPLDPVLVVKGALDVFADKVVLTHNHPSGNPVPGQADVKQTKEIKSVLDALHISLVDHLIMTESKYFSFANQTSSDL